DGPGASRVIAAAPMRCEVGWKTGGPCTVHRQGPPAVDGPVRPARPKARDTLWPPTPNELLIAASNTPSRGVPETTSSSTSGSWLSRLSVGGTIPSRRLTTVSAASSAPTAPMEWPSALLGAYTDGCGPTAALIALASARSPTLVEVACALTWATSDGEIPA